MMQFPRSMVLASFAALALAACQKDTPRPSAITSVTPVKVEAPAQATTTDQDLACKTPSDEPMQAAVVPAPSTRVGTPKQSARSFVAAHTVRAKSTDEVGVTMAQAVNEPEPAAPAKPEPAEPIVATSAAAPAPPPPAAATASVLFDNRLPDEYQVERVRMSVDGVLSYDGPSVGAMRVPPGNHLIEVIADYRLHDPVFTYVDGYRMELRTTGTVPASNSSSSFVAVAVPSGGATTPVEKRATLAWHRAP